MSISPSPSGPASCRWSRSSNPKSGGSPTVLMVTASSSAPPSGAEASAMFGHRAAWTSRRSASTVASRASSSATARFSSAWRAIASAVSRPSCLALPISLAAALRVGPALLDRRQQRAPLGVQLEEGVDVLRRPSPGQSVAHPIGVVPDQPGVDHRRRESTKPACRNSATPSDSHAGHDGRRRCGSSSGSAFSTATRGAGLLQQLDVVGAVAESDNRRRVDAEPLADEVQPAALGDARRAPPRGTSAATWR